MKWEYKIIDAAADRPFMMQMLNALGAEGWELVVSDSINQSAVFKRPLPEPQS